jgi:DNA sulfur modification protein DndD
MNLTKLSLENFGLFRDKNTFDLSTKTISSNSGSDVKPIILFGGKNGAGKTTLFEAFKLCLYGNTLPEFRVRGTDYQEYIKSKIHRSSHTVLQPASSLISLEFEYSKLGHTDTYTIERIWDISAKGLKEKFGVKLNGKPYEEIEDDQWQDFIKELIPIGVSNLFFFDGEQIQALASDDSDEIHLKESFYSLLGLDLIDRLQSDLQIHLTRNMKKSDSTFKNKLDLLYLEHKELDRKLDDLRQSRGDLENKKNNRKKRAEELQDRLAGEGGSFARKQNELRTKKTKLEAEIEQKYESIRDLCSGLLPFVFVPRFCIALKERIKQENNLQSSEEISMKLNNVLENVRKKTVSSINAFTDISNNSRKTLISNIKQVFDEAGVTVNKNKNKNSNLKMISHLSALEQSRILGWIEIVLEELPSKIRSLTLSLDKATRELQNIEGTLRKVPSDEVIAHLIEELNTFNQEIGKFDSLLRQTDEKIGQCEFKLKNLDFQIKTLQFDKKNFEKLNRGLKLANKVREALHDYEVRLKDEKLAELASSLINCLDVLMHKKIFNKAVINPDDFKVTLYDLSNKPIPKEELSAGEKQIYAIAILWALAKTSGRALPFIVDTPLGRLDSEHRLNLVQNFFPVASHQVIIFSTDTEIDKQYFEELSENIARSFQLDYSNSEGRTIVDKGYFWRTQ